MDDVRTELRRASGSLGEPGFSLRDIQEVKGRRERARRMRAAGVAAIVVAVTGAFVATALVSRPQHGSGTGVARNGRISYLVGVYGGSMEGVHLGTSRPDGSGADILTDGVPELITGGWSPDGSRIVFAHDPVETPDGDVGIWTMAADGTDLTQLTDGSRFDAEPQWSPDGSKILFLRHPEATSDVPPRPNDVPEIFVMDAEGSDMQRLYRDRGIVVLQARWSPTGSILFVGDDRETPGIGLYTMNGDGSGVQLLREGSIGMPQWSPDGRRILFQSGSRILTVDASGADERTLVDGVHGDVVFRWSPDGSRILFTQPVSVQRGEELWIVSSDGSGRRLVAEDLQWRDAMASWSPDGALIAFVRDGDIWTVDLGTGAQRQITDTPAYESVPAWSSG
jgi:Tol biopolymer transport system component